MLAARATLVYSFWFYRIVRNEQKELAERKNSSWIINNLLHVLVCSIAEYYGTPYKNTNRYYTQKRLIRYIYNKRNPNLLLLLIKRDWETQTLRPKHLQNTWVDEIFFELPSNIAKFGAKNCLFRKFIFLNFHQIICKRLRIRSDKFTGKFIIKTDIYHF